MTSNDEPDKKGNSGLPATDSSSATREAKFSPDGAPVSDAEWAARAHDWLPSEAERAHVISLMQRVVEPGKFAGWIAPPRRGVNGQPLDFEYVHLS